MSQKHRFGIYPWQVWQSHPSHSELYFEKKNSFRSCLNVCRGPLFTDSGSWFQTIARRGLEWWENAEIFTLSCSMLWAYNMLCYELILCETTYLNTYEIIELLVCIYEISRELVFKYGISGCSRCLTLVTTVNPIPSQVQLRQYGVNYTTLH